MIVVDRLKLTLPAGFEHRADRVARGVAAELARLPVAEARRLPRLAVPALEVAAGASDRQVARRIARAIHRSLDPGRSQTW